MSLERKELEIGVRLEIWALRREANEHAKMGDRMRALWAENCLEEEDARDGHGNEVAAASYRARAFAFKNAQEMCEAEAAALVGQADDLVRLWCLP